MIFRSEYVEKIIAYMDTPFIKVLTGVRRCGKSTIMNMLRMEIEKRGISRDRILHYDFDSLEYEGMTAKELFTAIKGQLSSEGKTYLFLDEIQEIKGWEKVVNSLMSGHDVDIYVTGSNSRMMSSEISTYLTGIGMSQLISNVPASLLLSGFARHGRELLLAVNVGGLGTLIASLASVISFKLYRSCDASCCKQGIMLPFTLYNLLFLLLLSPAVWCIAGLFLKKG